MTESDSEPIDLPYITPNLNAYKSTLWVGNFGECQKSFILLGVAGVRTVLLLFGLKKIYKSAYMMLSESQKEQILAEETYRNEIRASLGRNSGGRILTFLNSPFGLWLLTSVVLAIVGAIWTSWNAKQNRNAQENEHMRRIVVELQYRHRRTLLNLADNNINQKLTYEELIQPLVGPLTTDSTTANPAFPEFQNRTAQSLAAELQTSTTSNAPEEVIRVINLLKTSGPPNGGVVSAIALLEAHSLPFDQLGSIVLTKN